MGDKALVLQLLDTFFSSLDLKSYSIHNKSGLTSFTLRFNGRDPDSQSDTGTFIRKSKYHAERDKARSEAHKLSAKRERKQTQFYDAETEQENPKDFKAATRHITLMGLHIGKRNMLLRFGED